MESDAIRKAWEEMAAALKDDATSTLRDQFQNQLEHEALFRTLKDSRGASLLDVGCGNGYFALAMAKTCSRVHGIDFSENMIAKANALNERRKEKNVVFTVADVRTFSLKERFDIATTKRCIINLPSHEEQIQAIKHIHTHLLPQGRLLLLEGFQDGYDELNIARAAFGLPPITQATYNLMIDTERFLRDIEGLFTVEHVEYFGTYCLFSRFVHPLLVAPKEPLYDAEENRKAFALQQQLGGIQRFSPVRLYTLRKLSGRKP